MLLMVTNRRVRKGEYGDEERNNFEFEYQYEYKNGQQGHDGFNKTGKRGFEAALFAELNRLKGEEGINTPKLGIYLHGYNNDYQDSIDEIVDLEKHISPVVGYKPVIIGFSWPSSGKTIKYLSDREEVRDSVAAFTRLLLSINELADRNERDCFSTTFCIAHSMGNYLLRKGMEYMSDSLGNPSGRLLFNETVMLAPDIASEDIELDGKGRYIADFSRRVHVYYSKHDRALKASSIKRFSANRLGRHGAEGYENLAKNVVVVNARKYANSESVNEAKLFDRENKPVSVHSSHRYHPNILKDVVAVLSSVDRELITSRKTVVDEVGRSDLRPNHFELI